MPAKVDPSAYEWRNCRSLDAPLSAAVVNAASNRINRVKVTSKAVTRGEVDKALAALPAANYASELQIHRLEDAPTSNTHIVALIEQFRELESIFLYAIPDDFHWTILRNSCFLRLTYVNMTRREYWREFTSEAAEAEIIRFVTDFSLLDQGQPKSLSMDWHFSQTFAMKIVQAIEASPRCVTVDFSSPVDFEDRQLAGYADPVYHPVMALTDEDYEYKVLNVMEENEDGDSWANVAYFSRRTGTAIIITRTDGVTVTNDPDEIAVSQNPDQLW